MHARFVHIHVLSRFFSQHTAAVPHHSTPGQAAPDHVPHVAASNEGQNGLTEETGLLTQNDLDAFSDVNDDVPVSQSATTDRVIVCAIAVWRLC